MELISREEAMEAIRAIKKVMLTNAEVIKALYNIPTIESRPTGIWHQSFWKMPTAREVRLFCFYECDFCKNEVLVERIDGYNYCPHCGADMRGEE